MAGNGQEGLRTAYGATMVAGLIAFFLVPFFARILRFFPPDQLAPGDVLITNDIWLGTGHLPDITLAKPIFKDGKLVAFSATTAHAPDIGGKIRSPEPREVFEEGLQIPPMNGVWKVQTVWQRPSCSWSAMAESLRSG